MTPTAPATSEPTVPTARELVAGEVRAELARQRQTSNSLPRHIGKSQRYWYERLQARIPFSVDDLALLSGFLDVPMSNFMPSTIGAGATKKAPTPKGGGLDVHPLGLEPRTHWVSVSGGAGDRPRGRGKKNSGPRGRSK